MKKFLQKKLKNEKGLTLVELLAVIVILGIIAAIAVPAIGGIINNSKVGAMKSDILNAVSAAELYVVDNPEAETVSLENLQGTGTDAKNAAYISEVGGLKSFSYAVTTKLTTATATKDKITVTATSAPKKDIVDLKNGAKTGEGTATVKVTR
ncbi:type II secretion system protein [Sporosarcina obsidiansis]|uniref:type II secretion system protein n=1 Tax=Sporosarcina obsidiansis TaxID=2660748 RepID=UPI00129A4C18|nr:prepilin-type N-terminal cleavage/methylation domain-containing protein [Sporosarcina obsidiansis]